MPQATQSWGDITALPDGSLLLAHADRFDHRLIVLNPDGGVRWQRSYADVMGGRPRLLVLDGQPYLILESTTAGLTRLAIFAIDTGNATLARVFSGGTRGGRPEDSWATVIDGRRILLHIGGGSVAAIDLQP